MRVRGSVVGVEGEAGGGKGEEAPDDGELSSNKAVALYCTIYISKIGFSFFFFALSVNFWHQLWLC